MVRITKVDHRELVKEVFDKWWGKTGSKGTPNLADIGCADDYFKKYFESKGMKWFGVDKYPASDNVMSGTMENLPLQTGKMDLVFVCHAFEHTENPISSLREFHRVLKRGGYLIIITPYPCKEQIQEGDHDHLWVLHPNQMVQILNYTNFRELEVIVHKEGIEKQMHWQMLSIGRKI